jgi:hypothetical protein
MLTSEDFEAMHAMLRLHAQQIREALREDLRAFAAELSRLLAPVYEAAERQQHATTNIIKAVEELAKGMRDFSDGLQRQPDPDDWWRGDAEDDAP